MTNYLPTAFGQLAFAWKLLHYGLDGKIDANDLDSDLTWEGDGMVFVVPKAFGGPEDLQIALTNNLTIAFGAAAITLNRSREEQGVTLPNPISSDEEQCVALIYQIRNAFAHDIAEPKWVIRERFRRVYSFGGIQVDLTELDETLFEYSHIGGPDVMFSIKDYFAHTFLQEKRATL